MTKEIGVLTEALARPTPEDIVAGLKWLMDGGMQYPASISSAKAIEEYTKVLASVPIGGLRKALTNLKHGHYENINRDFIPIPANLAAMARAEAKSTVDDLTRLREKQATLADLADGIPARPDAAAKERVRSMLGRFRADYQASKARHRGEPVAELMSDEKAAYWSEIKGLKDAKEVTAEQQAFRRKIQMDMPEAQLRDAAE